MKNFISKNKKLIIALLLFFALIILYFLFSKKPEPNFTINIEQKSLNVQNNQKDYEKKIYYINDDYMVFTSDNNGGNLENDEYLYIKYFDTEQEVLLKHVTENCEISDVIVSNDNVFIRNVLYSAEPMSQGILRNQISYINLNDTIFVEKVLFSDLENISDDTMMKMYTLDDNIYFYNNKEIYVTNNGIETSIYAFSKGFYTNYIPSNYNKQLATLGFNDKVYRDVQIYDKDGLSSVFVLRDDITYPNLSSVKTGVFGVGKTIDKKYNLSTSHIFYIPFSNTEKYVYSENTVGPLNSIYFVEDTKYTENTALLYEFNDIASVKKFILATVQNDNIYTENLSIDFLDGAVDIISNENVIYIYQKHDLDNYAKITVRN